MAISLKKGQRINLSKDTGLSNVLVGLGWDPIEKKSSGGLFGRFSGKTQTVDVDIDGSVIMLESNDRLARQSDIVYYGNLKSDCGSVRHSGDNRTGDGDGDDEQIRIDLSKVPSRIEKLVVVLNIYNCERTGQHFGMLQNTYISLKDQSSEQELVHYDLTENYEGKTAMFVGEFYRDGSDWKFAAIGEATKDSTLGKMSSRY